MDLDLSSLLSPTEKPVHIMAMDGTFFVRSSDLCRVLGFSQAWQATERHAPGCTHTLKVGAGRPARYVDEVGFYRLIVAAKSPLAMRFQTWLFSELLPQLRSTGGASSVDAVLAHVIEVLAQQKTGVAIEQVSSAVRVLIEVRQWRMGILPNE